MKKAAKQSSKTRTKLPAKLPAKKPMPPKQAQPHGGAIYRGGIPGHAGAGGRPASELRARLVGTFAQRVEVIEQIADGLPVKRVEVSLATLLRHARCPKCDGTMESTGDTPAAMIMVEGVESASPSDRLKALDLAGKYGIGKEETLTIVSPDVVARLDKQVGVILRELPPADAERLLNALHVEVWHD